MIDLSQIEAVIFDMDGVLIDSEPLWKIAQINVFKTVGIDFIAVDCEQTVGLRIDEVVSFWHSKFPWSGKTKPQVVKEIMGEMVRLVSLSGKALPGVIESLEFFKSKDLKIGLATSSYTNLMECVLQSLEISSYFDFVHSAENEPYGKPHPQVYITVADKLNVTAEKCLVIEDSFNGIIAGKAAKMKVVCIPEKSHQLKEGFKAADFICESLIHLINDLK